MEQHFTINQIDTKSKTKFTKSWLIFLILGIIFLISGVGCIIYAVLNPPKTSAQPTFPTIPSVVSENKTYSTLTGEELTDSATDNAPIYCIQTPNGTDGARPQAGLTDAKIIFEAIAEAGITRFAAIYQNPTSAVIGPIRSLRTYYLEWDTPFDCTIVHAGGSPSALAALASGNYKDLSEDYTYMYRGTYGNRLWNNLFTTSDYLNQYASNNNYTSSQPSSFTRLTPNDSTKSRINGLAVSKLDITTPTDDDTSELNSPISHIELNFGGWDIFSPTYDYNPDTNTYDRSYADGVAHEVYSCPTENLGERNPEDICTLTQLSPSVVIAMIVQESKDTDNYHEVITTTGQGAAYIFQNGAAIEGVWKKASIDEQLHFYDNNGTEIALAPGQTWISAVPFYGSVDY